MRRGKVYFLNSSRTLVSVERIDSLTSIVNGHYIETHQYSLINVTEIGVFVLVWQWRFKNDQG